MLGDLRRVLSLAADLARVEAVTHLHARRLLGCGSDWVLVKGGHGDGDPVDLLTDGASELTYTAVRDDNRHTHGTGCTLASALASQLALGATVPEAQSAAAARARNVIAPNLRWRADIGDRFLKGERERLQALGWLAAPG